MKKTLVSVFILLFLCLPIAIFAQEPGDLPPVSEAGPAQDEASGPEEESAEEVVTEEAYVFPHISPRFFLSGGYRFTSLSGSSRAEEYEHLTDSFMAEGGTRIFSFPHRLHFDVDVKTEKNFFGDLDYAYKDMVVVKMLGRSIYHNLDTIRLIDLEPESAVFTVDARDRRDRYGISSDVLDVFLRFKTPDYPFHVYFDWKHYDRDGQRQQRSLLGSAYWNNLMKVTQSRDVDWKTEIVTVGANTHAGPVEADLSHVEKRFTTRGTSIFYDSYAAAADDPGLPLIRGGGIYPHNLIPDQKGSSDTLKLHSSYTGGLVGTATFSSLRRENRDSGVKADYFLGAGEIIWIPEARTAVFIRYRHRETDIDTPESLTLTDISNPLNTHRYRVKPVISSENDSVTGVVRYRLSQSVTLRAEYSYDHITRGHASPWMIQDSTERNTVALSADARIMKGLTLKVRYAHRDVNDPAYNTEPDSYDEGKISATWIPVNNVSALLSYSRSHQERRDMRFFDEQGNLVTGPDFRETDQDRLLGSVTFVVMKDLSVTGSYLLMHYKVNQDVVYQTNTFPLLSLLESRLPHRDTSQHVSVDLSYSPRKQFGLSTVISHTWSKGILGTMSRQFADATAFNEFSDIKLRETVFTISGEYRLRNGFDVGLSCKYADFDDVFNNPHDDVADGHASIILVKLSKRW